MRIHFIYLALVMVLLHPYASAQWVRTNGPRSGPFETRGNNITCLAVSDTNLFAGINNAVGGLYRSTIGGDSWTPLTLSNLYTPAIRALAVSDTDLLAGADSGWVWRRPLSEMLGGPPAQEVGVWQEIAIKPTSGQFRTTADPNLATFDGNKAKVMKASADSLVVRVPEQLVGNRLGVITWPDTSARDVQVVVRVVNKPGDTATVATQRVRFISPQRILYDEVTRATPSSLTKTPIRRLAIS